MSNQPQAHVADEREHDRIAQKAADDFFAFYADSKGAYRGKFVKLVVEAIRAAGAQAEMPKPCPHSNQATTMIGAMTNTGWTCKDCGKLMSESPAPYAAQPAPAAEHEAHCSLRVPATLNTADDRCDCALAPAAAMDARDAMPFTLLEIISAMLLEHDAGGITMATLRDARTAVATPALRGRHQSD